MPDYSMMAPVFQRYFAGNFGGQPGSGGNRAPGGAINPLASFGWTPGYGGVPAVPSPATTAGTATAGNMANLPGLEGLAGAVNTFNQQQAQGQLIRGLPNYAAMVQSSSGNILNELQGRVPTDVLRQMEQTAAERGIGTGTAGSASGNAALLRALGLTSLGLQQQGEQNLTGAIARTPQAPLFNPASFFVSPEQQQQAEAAAALYGAAPNPSAAAEEAIRQARAGGGGFGGRYGGGGYPGGGGGGSAFGPAAGAYARQPFAADRMINPPAGGALGTPTGPQEASPEGYQRWQDWASSMGWGSQGGQSSIEDWANWAGQGDILSGGGASDQEMADLYAMLPGGSDMDGYTNEEEFYQ